MVYTPESCEQTKSRAKNVLKAAYTNEMSVQKHSSHVTKDLVAIPNVYQAERILTWYVSW